MTTKNKSKEYRVYLYDISNLRAENVSELLNIRGIVTDSVVGDIKFKAIVFECARCHTHTNKIEQSKESNKLIPPWECSKDWGGCGRSIASTEFKVVDDESDFDDIQFIKIQENYDDVEKQPETIEAHIHGDLVRKITVGDRATLTGILKKFSLDRKSMAKKYFEVVDIEKEKEGYGDVEINEEDEKEIIQLSGQKDVVKRLAESLLPNIYGNLDIKIGFLLHLFGGVKKLSHDIPVRGDIHILLVGDPATAKSVMFRRIHKICARSIIASGETSTGVGLTASVTKKEFGGENRWVLEAGAMVLGNGGTVFIDEIDKIGKGQIKKVHSAMSVQKVNINKAGINAELKTEVGVIGACNPKHSRFDINKPLHEQIKLSSTLLSRFDLIYVLQDIPNTNRDGKIAEETVGMHIDLEKKELLSPMLIKKYIIYAKKNIKPKIPKELSQSIINNYVELRKRYNIDGHVPVDPRYVNTLIRLSVASAKIRLDENINVFDINLAKTVIMNSLAKLCVDEFGEFDIDRILLDSCGGD